MIKNPQKKLALINDITGYGRIALATALPIVSVMGVQGCPLPTSLLSNHTAFPNYYFKDLTSDLVPFIDNWKTLGLEFDGICSGFLGSEAQIEIVSSFIHEFKSEKTKVIIDPVMGDNGKAYVTYTPHMCRRMKELVCLADVITPNITEACLLTDTPYKTSWKQSEILQLAEALSAMGPSKVVITGIPQKTYIGNLCFEAEKEPVFLRTLRIGDTRHGTGDMFAAIIAADAVKDTDFLTSVKKASRFIKRCIKRSQEWELPLNDGVCFEEFLKTLN